MLVVLWWRRRWFCGGGGGGFVVGAPPTVSLSPPNPSAPIDVTELSESSIRCIRVDRAISASEIAITAETIPSLDGLIATPAHSVHVAFDDASAGAGGTAPSRFATWRLRCLVAIVGTSANCIGPRAEMESEHTRFVTVGMAGASFASTVASLAGAASASASARGSELSGGVGTCVRTASIR